MLYCIFLSTQVIEITATCFDLNQSSFRRAYEPLLVTICFCAFGIPDGLQFSYAYNVILIYYFHVLGCACIVLGSYISLDIAITVLGSYISLDIAIRQEGNSLSIIRGYHSQIKGQGFLQKWALIRNAWKCQEVTRYFCL